MPPVAAAPPIIGTLGRRRRPVRPIRFARNAPRTPPQSPGEGRLAPVRVRLASRQEAEHIPYCLRFQWRALSSFRAQRWRHVTSADASISRGFGTPNNLSRRPEKDRRAELRRMPKVPAQLGFLRTPKIDLDASGTFDRRPRDVICRGAVSSRSREASSFLLWRITLHSSRTSPTSHTSQQNRMPQRPLGCIARILKVRPA